VAGSGHLTLRWVTQVGVTHLARKRAYLTRWSGRRKREISTRHRGSLFLTPFTEGAGKQAQGATRESHQYRDGKQTRTKPYRTGYARGCRCCGPDLEAEASLDRGQDVLDDL
jgi:hypothetical protein